MQACEPAKERKEEKDWERQRRTGLKGWNIWRTHSYYSNTDDTTVVIGDNVPEVRLPRSKN